MTADRGEEEKDGLEGYGCRTIVTGPGGRVGIMRHVEKPWGKVETARQGRMKRTMREWCEGRMLPPEMFKSGGSYGKTGAGTTVAVFKGWQLRMYGFERHLDGTRTFIVADLDASKKQDNANQDLLARLKVRIDGFGKGRRK